MRIFKTLLSQPPQEAAKALFQTGQDLQGKNLRSSSWLEIAEGLQIKRIKDIVFQRLQAAKTREDVLRVLRLVRKHKRLPKKSGGHVSPATQPPPIVPDEYSNWCEGDYHMWEQWEADIELEIYGNGERIYQEWLLTESNPLVLDTNLRIPGLLPASPKHEQISRHALKRVKARKKLPEDLQSHLDEATRQKILQTFSLPRAVELLPEEEYWIERCAPHLLPFVKGEMSHIDQSVPVQNGLELAVLALLEEKYRISLPLLLDWQALAQWLVQKASLAPDNDATELVSSFYYFAKHAPLDALSIIARSSAQFNNTWLPLLFYLLPRRAELFPSQSSDSAGLGILWESLTSGAFGSFLALHHLRCALPDIQLLSPKDMFYDALVNLLMSAGGTLRHMEYPAFQVVCRPTISMVKMEILLEMLAIIEQFNTAFQQLQVQPLQTIREWMCSHVQECYHVTLEEEVLTTVLNSVEHSAAAYILLRQRIFQEQMNAAPFRLRRKHIQRFWEDWNAGAYRDADLPQPEFSALRAVFPLDVQIEGLAFALLDLFKENWTNQQDRTALKEGFLYALRGLGIAYRCILRDWPLPEPLRQQSMGDATEVSNYLIQQFIHAPLELQQALLLVQELPLLHGAQKTELERRAHYALRTAAGNSTLRFTGDEQITYACKPISKQQALLRGNLAGDCSTRSVPLRALSPHHVYYGLFKEDVQQRGYMTVFEAWAETANGEYLPVLCLETINLPNRELDGIQQDLLLIFDAIAHSRGLHSSLVLITSTGTWNFQNGRALQYCRRFRQGEPVNLHPADPVSWNLYTHVISWEASSYSAFTDSQESRPPNGHFRILAPLSKENMVQPENQAEAQRILALPRKQLLATAHDGQKVVGFISELPEII